MIDHFRLLAPLYDHFIKPPDTARLKEVLALPAPGALLDVGGGTGRVAQQLKPLVDFLVISDESPAMLQQAREKDLPHTVASGAERLPFPDGAFSRALVVDALHHFADQQQAIAELARVLAPGGRLVIEEPDLNRLVVKFVALAEKLALMRSRFFYPHEIEAMVSRSGLWTRVERDGQFAAWIVAGKD